MLGSLGTSSFIALFGCAPTSARQKKTDISVKEVSFDFEDILYRAPYMFGGRVVDRATLLNVHCRVRTLSGKEADGFGSMPLGNTWAFPSKEMHYDLTLEAMKVLAGEISRITQDCTESGHPIDLNVSLEPEYLEAAETISKDLDLVEPIPKLCTLVTASAFDAAIHDAFGHVHSKSCYATYGKDLMSYDLSHYLGSDFEGEWLSDYILEQPVSEVPIYHSVGALDALTRDESLSDLETLLLAREMGYTGVALKACKGQSQAMLMAAAAQKFGMSLSVMDLTCPGASFVHSAGIAAHVPAVMGIEHNSRQYLPAANEPWRDRYPGVFNIENGTIKTSSLRRTGLGTRDT
jgi:hypothetical protein